MTPEWKRRLHFIPKWRGNEQRLSSQVTRTLQQSSGLKSRQAPVKEELRCTLRTVRLSTSGPGSVPQPPLPQWRCKCKAGGQEQSSLSSLTRQRSVWFQSLTVGCQASEGKKIEMVYQPHLIMPIGLKWDLLKDRKLASPSMSVYQGEPTKLTHTSAYTNVYLFYICTNKTLDSQWCDPSPFSWLNTEQSTSISSNSLDRQPANPLQHSNWKCKRKYT